MEVFMIVLLCAMSFCVGNLFQLFLQAYIKEDVE